MAQQQKSLAVQIFSVILAFAGIVLTAMGNPIGPFLVFAAIATQIGYSITSALSIPKPRTPKTPAETFSFMGIEARAEEGMPVGLLFGKNMVGGNILDINREFWGKSDERLGMLVGIGEGKCEGLPPDVKERNARIFINDEPLSSYIKSKPNPIENIWWTNGTQTAAVPDWLCPRITTNYPQNVILARNGDKFVYQVKNQYAQGVEIGIAFLEGLNTQNIDGDDAGLFEGAWINTTFQYRDLDNPDVWLKGIARRNKKFIWGGTFNMNAAKWIVGLTTTPPNNKKIAVTVVGTPQDGYDDIIDYYELTRIRLVVNSITTPITVLYGNVEEYRRFSFAPQPPEYIWQTGQAGFPITFTQPNTWIDINPPIRGNTKDKLKGLLFRSGAFVPTSTNNAWCGYEFNAYYKANTRTRFESFADDWETPPLGESPRFQSTLWFPPSDQPKKYEIKLEQISQGGGSTEDIFRHKGSVMYVEEFEFDRLRYPKTCLLGISFKPTSRLSGGTPAIKTIWDGLYVYTLEESASPYTQQLYYHNTDENKVYGRNPACILYTLYRQKLPESSLDIASFKHCRDIAFINNIKFDYPIITITTMMDFVETFKTATGFYPIPVEGKVKLVYDKAMIDTTGKTITSIGTSVTGTNTKFLTECSVGDGIIANSQTRYIASIATDTTLTLTSAFSPDINNVSFMYTDPVVLTLTPTNMVERSLKYTAKPQLKFPNVAEVKFRDANNRYEDTSFTIVREDVLGYEPYQTVEFLFLGITNEQQAQRRGNIILNTHRLEGGVLQVKTFIEAIHLSPRDLIEVTHPDRGWVNKQFKIDKLIRNIEEPDCISIEATEYNPDIYKKDGTSILIPDKLSFRPPSFLPMDVENLYVTATREKYAKTLLLQGSFNRPKDDNFDHVEIYLSSTENDIGDYILNSTGSFTLYNIAVHGFYVITAISVSRLGRKSNSSVRYKLQVAPHIIYPPSNIQNFTATYAEGMIIFEWDSVEDPDFDYYEIRMGNTWENGTLIGTNIKYSNYTSTNIPFEGIYTYWIKAFDIFIDESTSASNVDVEIPTKDITLNVYSREEKNNDWLFQKGTLTSGSSSTTLYLSNNEGASSEDDFYNKLIIEIEHLGQAIIKNYTGSTREITLWTDYALPVPPLSGTNYKIYGTDKMFLTSDSTLMISSRKKCSDFRILNKG